MIKNICTSSLKVLMDYFIALILFVVFLMIPVGLAKENFYRWLSIYSFVIFILMFMLIYSDMKKIAQKEKRPQYNIKHYPFKGLIIGLVAIIPLALVEIIYPFILFDNAVFNRIKHVILNVLLGPVYSFIKIGNSSVTAYICATAIVPLIAMLGYLAGYYSFEASILLKKFSKKNQLHS
jgi:hypothetical protein